METQYRLNLVQFIYADETNFIPNYPIIWNSSIWPDIKNEFNRIRLDPLLVKYKKQHAPAGMQQLAVKIGMGKSNAYAKLGKGIIQQKYLKQLCAALEVDINHFNAEFCAAMQIVINDSFDYALKYSMYYHKYLHYLGIAGCLHHGIRNSFIIALKQNEKIKQRFINALPCYLFNDPSNPASSDIPNTGSIHQLEFPDGRRWYVVADEALRILKRLQDESEKTIESHLANLCYEKKENPPDNE